MSLALGQPSAGQSESPAKKTVKKNSPFSSFSIQKELSITTNPSSSSGTAFSESRPLEDMNDDRGLVRY